MKEQTKRAIVFGMVLMLAIPAAQISAESEALAGPFDTLSGSKKSGKRTHKQKSKKDSKVSNSKKKKKTTTTSRRSSSPSSRTTTTRRTTTSRSTPRATTTTRRRVDDRRTVRCTSSGRCDGDTGARTTTTRRTTTPSRRTTTPSRRTTTTRRTTTPSRRTTTTRRTTRSTPTRRTTTTTTRRRPVHHRNTRRTTTRRTNVHHHNSSHTEVHYHNSRRRSTNTRYYGGRSGGNVSTNAPRQNSAPVQARNPRELYLTGGVGLSAIAANQVADAPLPGLDFTLGLGAKRGLLVGELGFGLSGYRFDPTMAANTADLTVASVTGDVKLQPKLSFIEPYISAGLGGHVLNDHIIDEGAAGASLRLGAGVDLRFDNVALSAQYQRSFMGLVGDSQIYEDGAMSASTETLGLGLKIYF